MPPQRASRKCAQFPVAMFGPAGHAYVYRTRAHRCLNVAVQEQGVPGCVLIRAVSPVTGIAAMQRRRGDVPERRLTDGPAKPCRAFAIDMRRYGVDLTTRDGLAILQDVAVALPSLSPRRCELRLSCAAPYLNRRLRGILQARTTSVPHLEPKRLESRSDLNRRAFASAS